MILRVALAALALFAVYAGYVHWRSSQALQKMQEASLGAFVGPEDSKTVIVEFLDYRCAACREMHGRIARLREKHPEVKLIVRHYPIYGQPAIMEAQMALAAARQGKFEDMHNLLMSRDEPVEEKEIFLIVRQLSLDEETFMADMKDKDVGRTLLDTLYGTEALGIDSAPSFLIGGKIYTTRDFLPDVPDFESVLGLGP